MKQSRRTCSFACIALLLLGSFVFDIAEATRPSKEVKKALRAAKAVGSAMDGLMEVMVEDRAAANARIAKVLIRTTNPAIAAKRIARIEANYAKKKGFAVARLVKQKSKAVDAIGDIILGVGMGALEMFETDVIPYLLQGVLGGAGTPDILSLVGRLGPSATDMLSGLLNGLLSVGDNEPSALENLIKLITNLAIPEGLEDLDIPAALGNLLPILGGALGALLDGTAAPGVGGFPEEITTFLPQILARLVPDLL